MDEIRPRAHTHVTAVLLPEGFVAGVLAHFVSAEHVSRELFPEVVAAFAEARADHLQDHLLQLVRPGPQVVQRPPAGRLHHRAGARVGASLPQELDALDGVCGIKGMVQLPGERARESAAGLDFSLRAAEHKKRPTLIREMSLS